MRKTIIAGNWKMNHTGKETRETIMALVQGLTGAEQADIVIAPVFPYLPLAVELTKGTAVHVAAQNMHWLDNGAYTGEVSPAMLKDIGVSHVIIGHSERREYNNETDETVNQKVKSALAHGLTPILCCGETLAQRESGAMHSAEGQIENALKDIAAADITKVVIAWNQSGLSGPAKRRRLPEAEESMCYYPQQTGSSLR